MTDAGAKTQPIHDRMPVILPPDAWGTWLALDTSKEELLKLLGPAPDEALDAYPVSPWVSKAANDGERCIERMS